MSDTILLNIMEQLGDLKASVATIGVGVADMKEKQKEIATKVNKIEDITDRVVSTLEPDVLVLKTQVGRIGAIVGVASAILYGAFMLIQASSGFLLDLVKGWFAAHFH